MVSRSRQRCVSSRLSMPYTKSAKNMSLFVCHNWIPHCCIGVLRKRTSLLRPSPWLAGTCTFGSTSRWARRVIAECRNGRGAARTPQSHKGKNQASGSLWRRDPDALKNRFKRNYSWRGLRGPRCSSRPPRRSSRRGPRSPRSPRGLRSGST